MDIYTKVDRNEAREKYLDCIKPLGICPQVIGVYRQDTSVSMTHQSLISRRRVLSVVGAGATVALAGCSGNGENEPGNTQTETESPTEDTEDETTEGQDTETRTETEPGFSTEGDDSTLINASPEDLIITQEDIPLDGYSLEEQSTQDGSYASEINRTFRPNDSTRLEAKVEVYDEVSEAQTRYGQLGYDSLGLGESPDTTKELNIAVESKFESGSFDGGSASVVKLRDANVYGHLIWLSELQEPLELQVMGNIAVTMHQMWR